MKKIQIGLGIVFLLLSASTFTFAQTEKGESGVFSFNEMQSFMERMHPNFTYEEQKEMFDTCHGANNRTQNPHFNMMGN